MPAVTVRFVVARLPAAVSVLAEALMVRVEYVAVGIVLVSVNVHAPLEALGIVIVPVDTVISPELVSVVLTVRELDPTL